MNKRIKKKREIENSLRIAGSAIVLTRAKQATLEDC